VPLTDTMIVNDSPAGTTPARSGLLRGFTSALASLARSLARDGEPDSEMLQATIIAEPPPVEIFAPPQAPLPEGEHLNTIRNSLIDLLEHLSDDAEPAPGATQRTLAAEPPPPPPKHRDHDAPPQVHLRTNEEPASELLRHAILSGKTIGVIGFTEEGTAELGQAFAAQHCSFLGLTHADAEFRKGSTTSCDLLIVDVRPEWAAFGSGEVSTLLTSKKPVVLMGDRTTLANIAVLAQGGPRDFVPVPATVEELAWRTALLLSRIPGPKPRGKKKGRHLQIVIGDNDPSSRTLVHAVLAQEGMQCHAADNGAQALALAKAKCADAVVLDVNMPGLDGFQVLAELKRDPALASMRVILLTTRQAEADVLRGFGLGADDYVTKPFSPLELAARVKRLLLKPV
jgi:DNA-binding response OmpR family regulator